MIALVLRTDSAAAGLAVCTIELKVGVARCAFSIRCTFKSCFVCVPQAVPFQAITSRDPILRLQGEGHPQGGH
jgi:hypothetical protein